MTVTKELAARQKQNLDLHCNEITYFHKITYYKHSSATTF